jgi:hypothetical protein
MVLDGIISTIVGDHLDIAPTQAIGVVHSPNSVNPKSFRYGNTEPSMSRWLKACVENLQGASQADEDKFRPLWKHSESHRNDAVTQKCGVTYAIIGFALMVGFIASMNTSGMTAMDILVLGFIPTLFLIAILYGSNAMPLYEAIRKVDFPNSVNAKAVKAMPIPSQA